MDKQQDFPKKVHGIKCIFALFQLPYWQVSLLHLYNTLNI